MQRLISKRGETRPCFRIRNFLSVIEKRIAEGRIFSIIYEQ